MNQQEIDALEKEALEAVKRYRLAVAEAREAKKAVDNKPKPINPTRWNS